MGTEKLQRIVVLVSFVWRVGWRMLMEVMPRLQSQDFSGATAPRLPSLQQHSPKKAVLVCPERLESCKSISASMC
jgi:hypothetical protein